MVANQQFAQAGLLETLGPEISMEGCFNREYWKWEKAVAQPALEAQGYKVLGWYTQDGDDCGPLVRAVTVEKDGVKQVLTYG